MDVLSILHGGDAGPELFAPLVAAAGHRLDEWRFESGTPPALDGYGAVIVWGGFMHPDQDDLYPWLRDETEWLRALLEQPPPTLGICLGSELLARAAGARVGQLDVPVTFPHRCRYGCALLPAFPGAGRQPVSVACVAHARQCRMIAQFSA